MVVIIGCVVVTGCVLAGLHVVGRARRGLDSSDRIADHRRGGAGRLIIMSPRQSAQRPDAGHPVDAQGKSLRHGRPTTNCSRRMYDLLRLARREGLIVAGAAPGRSARKRDLQQVSADRQKPSRLRFHLRRAVAGDRRHRHAGNNWRRCWRPKCKCSKKSTTLRSARSRRPPTACRASASWPPCWES